MDVQFEGRGGDADFSLMPRLFPPPLRPVVSDFGRFVRLADKITDNPSLSRQQKTDELDALAALLDGNDTVDASNEVLTTGRTLHKGLTQTGVSSEHAKQLLMAFRRDVTGARIQTWNDLRVYCQFAAAPIGRFMLDLLGEDIAVCGPATDALCIALRILKRLRDCKNPSSIYSRLCIPEQFMRDAYITTYHLEAPSAKGQTRAVIDRVLDGVDRLLLEASPLPRVIKSAGLSAHTAIVLCRARKLARRFREQDPLNERVGLSPWQRRSCKWLCILQGLLIRPRNRMNSPAVPLSIE